MDNKESPPDLPQRKENADMLNSTVDLFEEQDQNNFKSEESGNNDSLINELYSSLNLVSLPDDVSDTPLEFCEKCVSQSSNEVEFAESSSSKLTPNSCLDTLKVDGINDTDYCSCATNANQATDVCPYCRLLQANTSKSDKLNFKQNCEYFSSVLTESKLLLEESKSWFSGTDINTLHTLDTRLDSVPSVNENIPVDSGDVNVESCINNDLDILNNYINANDLLITDLEDEIAVETSIKFSSLSDEILLKIFSFFTQRELCRYVAPVCSAWFCLAKDPSFWTCIYANDFEDVFSKLLVDVILAWCQWLIKLELNRRTDIVFPDFLKIFQNCPNLKDLSVSFCTQVDDKILQSLSVHCKNLTSINMEGCSQITDQCFYKLIGLPLTAICFPYCNQISDEGGIFLAQNFQNLIEINFDGIQWITEDFVNVLVENHADTLQSVSLDGENLTDDSISLFSTCPHLKSLNISFCTSMTHDALRWAAKCSGLNQLKLRKGAYFTNAALLDYFKNMSVEQGENFKLLNLAECTEISDECLFHLAEKCKNLEVLDLSWCWEVSDDGLAFIVDNCHELRELHLKGLYELYGTPFSHVVTRLPKLTFLDLSQCNKVQDELIERVVEKMQNLIVWNYYGDIVVNALHRRAHMIK